jgi:hypothetical protein
LARRSCFRDEPCGTGDAASQSTRGWLRRWSRDSHAPPASRQHARVNVDGRDVSIEDHRRIL